MTITTHKSHFTLLSTAQVLELEASAVQQGTPVDQLMQNAGKAVAETIMQRFERQPTLVLCGPGHNGGDALIAAKILQEHLWPISIGSPENLIKDGVEDWLKDATLIIDGLFGTGLSRPITSPYQELIKAVNQRNLSVVAIDIASGINSDSAAVMGVAMRARLTITFGYQKLGHVLYPGRDYMGEVIVKDIGLGAYPNGSYYINHPELWRDYFPIPTARDHKYTRGHALVFGGEEYTGATQLASLACRRAGSGLVTIVCSEKTHPIYATSAPGTITKIIRGTQELQAFLRDARKNAILIGPGLEPNATTKDLVLTALSYQRRYVLDAGALKCFASDPQELFQHCSGNVILTPHEGEFATLFHHHGNKRERALSAARQSNCIIVLKGPDTVIAHPDGRAFVQSIAPPWLATAGSGDVLSGMILGYLAQGVDPFYASAMAVWIHGQCAQEIGFGLIAEDLITQMPAVLKSLQRMRDW